MNLFSCEMCSKCSIYSILSRASAAYILKKNNAPTPPSHIPYTEWSVRRNLLSGGRGMN